MTTNKFYFRNLDGIRFVAAFMVLLSHIFKPAYNYIQMPFWLRRFFETISSGGTGVTVFFVMSGFLITYLLIDEKNKSGKISLKNFYIRRTLRIWPLYFLVILFAFYGYPFLKQLVGKDQVLGTNFWMHASFLSNFDVINVQQHCFGKDAMSQNITWSISIEEQFYLIWPLIFTFLPNKIWPYTIVTLLLVSLTYRLAVAPDETLLYFHTLSVLPDLAFGGLLAWLVHTKPNVRRFFENTSSSLQLCYLVVFLLVLFFNKVLFSFPHANAISRFIIAPLICMIIGAQALTVKPGRWQASNWRFANKWGCYTYSMYLLHPFAMIATDVPARLMGWPEHNPLQMVVAGLLSLVLTFLLSYYSYQYFEKYFLSLKHRF